MTPIEFIRRQVFAASQVEFATIAGVMQSTVSRWEKGEFQPGAEHLKAIREEAARRRIAWSDAWLFEAPKPAPTMAEAS
jgi:transcriptional regulator with XRE-family HTH domain